MTKREAVAEFARANSITEEAVHNRIRRGSLAFANGELVKCVGANANTANTNITNTNNVSSTNTNTNTANDVSIANTAVPSIEEEAEGAVAVDREARKKALSDWLFAIMDCKLEACHDVREDYLSGEFELNEASITLVYIMLERGLLSQNDIEQIHRDAPEIIRLNNIDDSNKGG